MILLKSITLEEQYIGNICIGIDFKTPLTVMDPTSCKQILLQYNGALLNRSNKDLPILFVLTDLQTFKFVWLSNEREKSLRVHETQDVRYSIELIKRFIDHHYKKSEMMKISTTPISQTSKLR